jgi:S1-C subfamily serine protease
VDYRQLSKSSKAMNRRSHALTLVILASLACPYLTAHAQKVKSRSVVTTPARTASAPLSPRDIARIAFPSTVSVYAVTDDGDVFAGTGFVVRPGVVATCYHVVEDTAAIAVAPLSGDRTKLTRARLIKSDTVRDLALLAVPSLKLPSLRFSAAEDFYVGEAAYTIGNPKGLEGTFSTGVLSNFHKLDTETYLLQFTASASPGNSGGPLLNDKGEVIGIVSSQFNEGQNLNFAISAIHLRILLEGRTDAPHGYLDNNLEPPKKP